MSLSKPIVLLGLILAVGGCGFRPLYAPPEEDVAGRGVYAFDIFRKVAIDNIKDREGQFFRNELIRLLHPQGRSGEVLYLLNVQLNEGTTNLAVKRSAVATRANLTVNASFTLRDLRSDTPVHSGAIRSSSGYNIFNSEFQTLMAEKGARERALKDLAQQLRVRLAALLTTSEQQTKQP